MEKQEEILKMENLSKSFQGNPALKEVDFSVKKGEVHGLVGENGAGKSTLMKILSGIYAKDEGKIFYRGQEVTFDNPRKAQSIGIFMIQQEVALCPYLTVAENIALGREPLKGFLGIIDSSEIKKWASEVVKYLDFQVNVNKRVRDLSIAEQQMVEISRALARKADVLILDEPTAMLTNREVDALFRVIELLRSEGITIIYISHRLEEIFRICDRITVLRDGEKVKVLPIEEATTEKLILAMTGGEVSFEREEVQPTSEEVVLEVKNLSRKDVLDGIDFKLYKGEILCFAGLVGSGRTDVAKAIFGVNYYDEGEILIKGEKRKVTHPQDAIKLGMGFVPEDRHESGLILTMAIKENITLASLDSLVHKWGLLNLSEEKNIAEKASQQLRIIRRNLGQKVTELSGGNQQKVVIAKWFLVKPDILILDEPTRGIDVGTKAEIHRLIIEFARQGGSVLMISSELPEVKKISSRIIVMRNGEIAGEMLGNEADDNKILNLAFGREAS